MAWRPDNIANLREVLANLYPTATDARRMITDAGLKPHMVGFENKAINTWFNILEHAKLTNQIDTIVALARKEFPDAEVLQHAVEGNIPPILHGPETRGWHGPGSAAQLEKIMG